MNAALTTASAALLADAVLVLHLGFVGFVAGGFVAVLLGGPLRWGWVRSRPLRLAHLGAIAFVAAEALLGVVCPLTRLEHALRGGGSGTLVGRLVAGVLYYDLPLWVFSAAYVALAALAVALWFLVPPRRRRQAGRTGQPAAGRA